MLFTESIKLKNMMVAARFPDVTARNILGLSLYYWREYLECRHDDDSVDTILKEELLPLLEERAEIIDTFIANMKKLKAISALFNITKQLLVKAIGIPITFASYSIDAWSDPPLFTGHKGNKPNINLMNIVNNKLTEYDTDGCILKRVEEYNINSARCRSKDKDKDIAHNIKCKLGAECKNVDGKGNVLQAYKTKSGLCPVCYDLYSGLRVKVLLKKERSRKIILKSLCKECYRLFGGGGAIAPLIN